MKRILLVFVITLMMCGVSWAADPHKIENVSETGLGARLTFACDIDARTSVFMDYGAESTDLGLSASTYGHQVLSVDADEDSWGGFGWTADDTFTIQVGGSATKVSIPNAELSFPVAHAEDSGQIVLHNMSVSATPADGTEQSFWFQIDSNNIFGIKADADSAGGVDTYELWVGGMIESAVAAGSPILKAIATTDTPSSDPETDAEQGWLEIDIGGSSYYLPYYN